MKLKHKVIKEFQFLTPDKKILILKVNTVLEEYVYTQKDDKITIDKDIVDNNPEFFVEIDWKAELLSYLKTNKIPQPAVLSKKLFPFIEEMILSSITENKSEVDLDYIKYLEQKEYELSRKESRLTDNEDDIEVRINRIQKREDDYKQDLKSLTEKEKEFEKKQKELLELETSLIQKESDLNEKITKFETSLIEFKEWEIELNTINQSITNWEEQYSGQSWKAKRKNPPPSCVE